MRYGINLRWIFVMTEYSNYYNAPIEEILKELSIENKWKIGLNTIYKYKLSKDDKLIFYVSGKGRMYFIASAVLDSKFIYEGEYYHGYVKIRNMNFFDKPVFIKPILDKLSFIKNKKHWGIGFQKGIIQISKIDYDNIISETEK